MLICPVCKLKLNKNKNVYCCNNKHSFDIAKEGYLNLLGPKASPSGDNQEMITARDLVHKSNLYENLALKINELLSSYIDNNQVILDSGCGEGYYLNYLKSSFTFQGIGVDISKFAIKKASKRYHDLFFIVASSADLPLKNNSVDIITAVFSPWFNKEFKRVLKDEGILLLVSPGEKHLLEIKNILYDKTYLNEEKHYDLPDFKILTSVSLTYQMEVKDVLSLVKMTPYYYKTDFSKFEYLKSKESLLTTFDFKILIYKKNS